MPVSVVVQLVEPLVSDAEVVETGATAWTSGATSELAMASASETVSVDDVPKPPRTPLDDVVEPEWPDDLEAEWGQWSPLRGGLFPGTAVFVTHKPAS